MNTIFSRSTAATRNPFAAYLVPPPGYACANLGCYTLGTPLGLLYAANPSPYKYWTVVTCTTVALGPRLRADAAARRTPVFFPAGLNG